MHKSLANFFRYILICAMVILVLLVLGRFVQMMNWPWWVGGFLLLILLGVWAGTAFVRKLILRRREQHFVLQVTKRDDDQLKELVNQEQNSRKDLQDRWKGALEALRQSDLKKQGNPLYVLPWYLVMGESGSGKTTAIKSARLFSPFAELHEPGPLSGTRNCDWCFSDQAILIDTAGRYAMPTDPETDNNEWQEFLSLLVKYRKREPIHGLVVTIAADKLVKGSTQELEKDGRQLRLRIDQLIRVLGFKFPVYLLVTKLDLIEGMTQFSNRLPQKSLDQAMGMVNDEMSTDVQGFLERSTASVADRLRNLRILLLHRPENSPVSAGLLLFPEQVQLLKPGLESFVRGAFQQNRYQDTPLLRGIYLGSGRQQLTPCTDRNGNPEKAGLNEVLGGTSRGLFLHDFFEKVLPGDRGMLTPATRAMQWNKFTRNIGLTSWVLIGTALCGLLSYSFIMNMAAIREASAVIARIPDLNGDTAADLASMDRFRLMIVNVEKQNLNWWLPRFGLNQSRQAELALKTRYCRLFHDRFLALFDRDMATAVAGFSASTRDDVSGRYLVHLSRRINLMEAGLDGAGIDTLRWKPLPSYLRFTLPEEADKDTTRRFGDIYLDYLVWRADRSEISKEVQVLKNLLKQVVAVKGVGLAWLLDFANQEAAGSGIILRSFWGGSRQLPAEPIIEPAFTGKGKVQVTALLNDLCAAYPGAGLQREKVKLESEYRDRCFAAWQRFAASFAKGEERLVGAREWRDAAAVMATERGPYAAFMRRAVVELEPFGIADRLPPWLSQLYQYQAWQTTGTSTGGVASAVDRGKTIARKLGKVAGQDPGAVAGISSTNLVQEYLVALEQMAPVAGNRALAHQMAQQAFSEDPAVSKSPLYLAADAAQRLNGVLSQGRTDQIFSRLISGPIAFYGSFVRMETACSLQKQWEEHVLKEVQGISDSQTLQYLLEREGPVWKFVSDFADPFLGWNPGRGYHSKSALGGAISFNPGFYSFRAKGAKVKTAVAAAARQSYYVTFKGLPTDANSEARIKPQSTRLELQCATGSQVIDNLNYPVSKTFVWSPDSCSDVLFQVDMGEVILTKKYPGPQGFPDFLKDFPGGRRTFLPQQFPMEKQALERMGIGYIRANYQLSGGRDIPSGRSKSLPGQIPLKIAECWD